MIRKLLFVTISPIALASCAAGLGGGVTPVTPGQSQPLTAQERQTGATASAELVSEFGGEYTREPTASYVDRVGRRIAVQSGLSSDQSAFDVTVLDSPVPNALALPGGYVFVTRGLLALMNDEAELAAVMGHEVGHVAARHSQQRQSAAQRNSLRGALGQVLAGVVAGNSAIGQLLGQAAGTGAQLATLSYSRAQESQADQLGVAYLRDAGWDTDALASMLGSLDAQTTLDQRLSGSTRAVPEWASTHPEPGARVRDALADARAAGGTDLPRNRDAHLDAIDGMLYGDNPAQGVIEGTTFLHPELRVAFTAPQGYSLNNSTRAVTVSGSGGQAQFSGGSYSGDLDAYVARVFQQLGGSGTALPAVNPQRTTINGIPAAVATTRATVQNSSVDVSVIAYGFSQSQAYHFIVIAPAGQGLGPLSSLVQSVRRLSASEAAAIKPRYLRVVTVRAGDTPSGLASRMAYDSAKLERFLVLNGLDANATLRAGDRVKIVTY